MIFLIKRSKETDTACVLRCLVFKTVTITWGNMLLSSFVMMIKHVVCCTADAQYTAKFSCDWVIMEYTYDKCCDMLLTLSLCNSQTGTVCNKYTVYLDTNVCVLVKMVWIHRNIHCLPRHKCVGMTAVTSVSCGM